MPQLLQQLTTSLSPRQIPAQEIPALYVHVPFCFHKCHYCDFYSITRQTPERMNAFVDRIVKEAQQWAQHPVKPRTIFFGGGTPSLLPLASMHRLLLALCEVFDFSQLNEWTIECNPATVTLEYLQMLRDNGVNRLSFGAQSFDRAELAMLEREHNPDDVPRSIDLARRAGFDRLNVDLIYAIPGQTLESWSRSLDEALALNTKHLSCYGLTYEPNTPMTVKKRLGVVKPVEETLELEMLRYTRTRLEKENIHAYEISNYAIEGEECRHNLAYWFGENYIGLGPSAASHVTGIRWRNRPHIGEWEQAIDEQKLPAIEAEHLTPRQRAGELAMLMLRLRQGIDFRYLNQKLGVDAEQLFANVIDRYTTAGLLQRTPRGVALTDAGLAVADSLASEFLE